MDGLAWLLLLLLFYWLTPVVLFFIGLIKLKSKPVLAKKLLIASGIMVLVGAGVCGALLMQS